MKTGERTSKRAWPIEQWHDAARDLFRAFRTYPEVQDAMKRIRDASIGGYGQARYIAAWHNLSSKIMIRTLGNKGIDLIVCALGYEIANRQPPSGPEQKDLYVGILSKMGDAFTPIAFDAPLVGEVGSVPTITLRLSMYKDRAAFMRHMQKELPRLYDRLTNEQHEDREQALKQRTAIRTNYQNSLEALATKIDMLGGYEKVLVLPSDALLDAKGRPFYDPASGLTAEEWDLAIYGLFHSPDTGWLARHFTPSPAAASERRSQIGRRSRGFPQLARDVRWWREYVESNGRKSMNQLATEAGLNSHTEVSKAISDLEARFRLEPFDVRSRTARRR